MINAKQCVAEMSQLWHTSRTATAGKSSTHARYLWAAQEFSKAHPEFSPTAAYKLIDRMLARYPACNDVAAEEWANQVLTGAGSTAARRYVLAAHAERLSLAPTRQEDLDPRRGEEPIVDNE